MKLALSIILASHLFAGVVYGKVTDSSDAVACPANTAAPWTVTTGADQPIFKTVPNTRNQVHIRVCFTGDNGVIVKARPGGGNTTLSTSTGRCADFHGFTTISVSPLNAKRENGIYCRLP